MKPHIWYSKWQGCYLCVVLGGHRGRSGHGRSPAQAYENWKRANG